MGKITKDQIEDIISLAPLQEGMLFYYLNNKESNLYFNQLSIELSGNLDLHLFKKSWQYVIDSNEMLRTVFRWEKISKPVQLILRKKEIQFKFHDISSIKDNEKDNLLNEIKGKDKIAGFDLTNVPFRLILVKYKEDKHFLIISNHHIIYDGWSNGIILKEFFENYERLIYTNEPVIKNKNKFKEYLKYINNGDISYKKYWNDYLKNLENKFILPFYSGNESNDNLGLRNSHKVILSAGKVKKLKERSEKGGITLANIIYSSWGLLLKKYSALTDIIFGTTVSGRNIKLKGINEIVGLFINTVPLRLNFENIQTINDLLIYTTQNLREREDFENTPLIRIIESNSNISSNELFESIIVIENYPIDKQISDKTNHLQAESFIIDESTNYKLTVSVMVGEVIEINFSYSQTLMNSLVIENLGNHLLKIINLCIENPQIKLDEIDILSESEKKQILYEFNQTKQDYSRNKTISQLFEEQVAKTPNAIAIHCENERISYKELSIKSEQLAKYLMNIGCNNTLIGIIAERSIKMIIGVLGILKSGNAYLPLDANHPKGRNSKILKISETRVVLTDLDYMQIDDVNIINLCDEQIYIDDNSIILPEGKSKDLVYVIYTSGSTGDPKGVMVEQGNVINFVHGMKDIVCLKASESILSLTTISFDIFGLELFVPLLSGASMFLVYDNSLTDMNKLLSFIENYNITVLQLTPSRLNLMLSESLSLKIFKLIKTLLIGGEELSSILHEKICQVAQNKVYNMYGPTETTIWSTYKDISNNSDLNIGKPIINTQVYILGSGLDLLPIGIVGELYISGDGVARGYYNNERLTKSKFIDNPFIKGERLYRTGDLARWLPDGNIEFLGRLDDQVKIKGFRIELGEIENCLLKHDSVKDVAVIAREDEKGDCFLCAYIIPARKEQNLFKSLKMYLSVNLPNYMIPSYFVELEKMPLTPNGKVNKRALSTDIKIEKDYVAPSNKIEQELIKVWSDILNIDQKDISVNSSFFELGGHSLKVTNLVSRIEKDFGIRLSVSDFFNYTTIKDISELMEVNKWLINDQNISNSGMKKIRI